MLWWNRLQQRLSLTRSEALALLSLSGLLIIGLTVRHVQQRAVPVPIDAYDEMDRLFFERSARADSAAGAKGAASGADPASSAPTGADPAAGAPTAEEAARAALQAAVDGVGPDAAAFRIDVNTAGAEELERLPRIGPALAARILAFRADYGPFLAIDDLRQVRGIGAKTLELLRPHVSVGAPIDSLRP